jgi:thioredoxin reductase (NADPH)
VLRDRSRGTTETVPAESLFALIGALPHTDWLSGTLVRDDRGYVVTGSDLEGEGWPLARPPLRFETSMPGVFAVGDVRHASVKRVASAVGEGSAVVMYVHEVLAQHREEAAPFPADGARARNVDGAELGSARP